MVAITKFIENSKNILNSLNVLNEGVHGGKMIRLQNFKNEILASDVLSKKIAVDYDTCTTENRCSMGKEILKLDKEKLYRMNGRQILAEEFETSDNRQEIAAFCKKSRNQDDSSHIITCCKSCFFTSKILTLVELYGSAAVPLDYESNDGKYKVTDENAKSKRWKYTAYGIKTKASVQNLTFRNFFCLELKSQKYLIIIEDNKASNDNNKATPKEIIDFKFIKLTPEEKNPGFFKLENETVDLQNKENGSIGLVRIPYVYLPGDKLQKISIESVCHESINSAFFKAYPRKGLFDTIPMILNKKAKKNPAVFEVPENGLTKKKIANVFSISRNPAFYAGLGLTCICLVIFIIREKLIPKPKKFKKVNFI